MSRRAHGILTVLAGAGAALALFQCWYVYLPIEDAKRFDLCQIGTYLDCFKSLNAHGPDLVLAGLPVFATLAAVLLFQAALAVLAWTVPAGERDAWLAPARVAAFPAAGLAVFVLLNDVVVAKATSVSAVLVAVICLAVATRTVMEGLPGAAIRAGLRPALAVGLGAALAGFFLGSAGGARYELDQLTRGREAAPPQVLYPRFALAMPRRLAAWVGDRTAATEVLLFVDPEQEESRRLMREAAALEATDVFVAIYAPGEHGARLVIAQHDGRLRAYLNDPAPTPGEDLAPTEDLLDAQRIGREAIGVTEYPTALWRGGKATGSFTLGEVLAKAR